MNLWPSPPPPTSFLVLIEYYLVINVITEYCITVETTLRFHLLTPKHYFNKFNAGIFRFRHRWDMVDEQ